MTTLLPLNDSGKTPMEQVLGLRPALLEAYRDFYGTLWDNEVLPARLLELTRLLIATEHFCDAELAIRQSDSGVTDAEIDGLKDWRSIESLSSLEKAALAYAQQIPWNHHQITDDQVNAVKAEIGDAGFVALNFAATFFDANCRLRLLFEMPASATESVKAPASATGILY
jgi:alkylhydroperoxidase family enzyme